MVNRRDSILWHEETFMTEEAKRDAMTADQRHKRETTFVALYRRYVKRVYAYCYRRVGNRTDAEDLTEQVFIEALEKYDDYEERGKAAAWLFTIAHSRLVDHYRRRRRDLPFDETMDHPGSVLSPERQVINNERRQRLFAVLDDLDEAKRELILLRFGAELTYQEIGEIVGKREAAVKMALYRLLDELRGLWHLSDYEASRREEYDE